MGNLWLDLISPRGEGNSASSWHAVACQLFKSPPEVTWSQVPTEDKALSDQITCSMKHSIDIGYYGLLGWLAAS